MANPFDQFDAGHKTSNNPFDQFDANNPSAPARKPGATGFGMVGELFHDLTHDGPADHDPNAIEQGIMKVAGSKPIQGAKATFKQAAVSGLFAEPTRMVMEGLNVGRKPGESDAAFHQRYNQALIAARQQTKADADAARVGSYGPDSTVGDKAARLGQQALNTGANIVANPEYFLLPGGGVGKTAIGRVANAGAVNAGIGSISDAAAQLMDQAEGVKKDFDIKQNLESTITSGLFGAGLHGTIEVAPFVQQLFSKRGMDTKPAADPRSRTTSPMTGDTVQLNPEEQAQFKDLLRTGSVDDIKNFLNTKQGPKPSWSEVNQLVNFRDNLPAQFIGKDKFDQAAGEHQVELKRQVLENHVNEKTAGWKNAPQIEVSPTPEHIADPQIRAQALKDDADGRALGFLGADGKVRMFSDRIHDPDTASAVLYHEALGHHGLAEKFGARLDQTLQTLMDRNVNQFSKHVDAWQKENPGEYGGDRIRAAEEVLANYSEKGPLKKSWQDALNAAVMQFGRKMGLKLAYSDGEVRNILAMAHDAVINGKPSAVSNGFRGATQNINKYMFTGERAQNFNPNDATTYHAKDGKLRNEIDDYPSKVHEVDRRGDYNLEEVLDHPELYKNYPQLRELPVRFDKLPDGEHGYYETSDPHIGIDVDTDNLHSALLHEVQHAIQHIEGHINDSTPSTTKLNDEAYRSDPLEHEAFATEDRRYFSPEMRAENPPKFMRKPREEAAEADYVAHDIERIYNEIGKDNLEGPVHTWEQDRRAALDLGFSPSQIKALRDRDPGELSTRVRRMQAAANKLDMEIKALNQKLDTPDWTMADQGAYIQKIADFSTIFAKLQGETSEYARALNAAKAARSYTKASMQEVAAMLEDQDSGLASLADDPTNFLRFARKVKELMDTGNDKGAQVLLRRVMKPKWEQYVTSFHMNAMLSGLSTHVKAPLDMMTGITHDLIDHTLAMPVGKMYNFIEGLTGREIKPGVSRLEVVARVYGVTRAVFDHEVYSQTLKALKTGEGSAVLPSGEVIHTAPSHTYMGTANPRLGILSKPTDLIVAQDTYFRSVSISEDLYGMGIREAEKQLKESKLPYTDTDVLTLGATIARDPTATMIKIARKNAERALLLSPNRFTSWIDKVKAYRPGMGFWERVGAWTANNLAPFIRVSANSLLIRTVERSPLQLLSKDTRKTILEGGPEGHIVLSRILYGTVKLGIMWSMADKLKNKLTGEGPDNPDKRKELEAAGWRRNAVHENGRYNTGGTLAMSLNPFDMHNSTAQMVASMREAYEKGANQGQVATGLKLALGSILHDFESESWVDSVAPAVEAANAEGSAAYKIEQFVGEEAKTFVPNLLGQVSRMTNPNRVDTRPDHDGVDPTNLTGAVANSVQSAIPFLNENLPTRYSVYGTPLKTGQTVAGQHTAIPGIQGNGVEETNDPAEIELNRLAQSNLRIVQDDGHILDLSKSALITPVQRTFTLNVDDLQDYQDSGRTDLHVDDNGKVTLTTAQFEEYQRLVGQNIVETVRQEMSTPEWQNMSDEERVLEIKDIQTDIKKAAKEALFDQ